jgi:hypothetical protein
MSVDMAATAAGEREAVARIEVPVEEALAVVVVHRELSWWVPNRLSCGIRLTFYSCRPTR